MAILMVYDAVGDTEELLASYHKAGDELKGELPAGTLAHICVPTATGFRTFVVMESEDHARNAFASESSSARDLVHKSGLVTERRSVEVMPVFAFSVSKDVHDKQAMLKNERNGGGSGPSGSGKIAVGENKPV
jgi:hypothetical protein